MNVTDTPTNRRQAALLAEAQALPTDKARAEFVRATRAKHGRFAAILLSDDIAAWKQSRKKQEGVPCSA